MKKETKDTLCVHCGKIATRVNAKKQPVCEKHKDEPPKEIACPDCGFPMEIREGRFGYFWGCKGFPGCKKTLSLKQALKMEKYGEEED